MPAVLPLLLLLLGPADDKPKEQGERELKFGLDVAREGDSGRRPASVSRRPSCWIPTTFRPSTTWPLPWSSRGSSNKGPRGVRESPEAASPGNVYIQQNYDLFREADDKRNREVQEEVQPRARPAPRPPGLGLRELRRDPDRDAAPSRSSTYPRFRRVLVAGFVTDQANTDIDLPRGNRAPAPEPAPLGFQAARSLEPDARPSSTLSTRSAPVWADPEKWAQAEREQYLASKPIGSSKTPSSGERSARSIRTR